MVKSLHPRLKRIIRRTFWIILKIAGVFLLFTVIFLILLQTSFVQNFARQKIQAYLESKLRTKLAIGELSIDFPKKIVLKNIYLEDQDNDTLLYAELVNLDVNLWGLFSRKLVVNNIQLDRWTVNIERIVPDSGFNYDFITKAFGAGNADREKAKEGNSQWMFEVGNIHLTNIRARYRDDASGNDLSIFLPDLQTKIKTFDPGQLIFKISDLSLKGLNGHIRLYKPAMILQKEEIAHGSKTSQSKPINLQFNSISLDSVLLVYSDELNNTKANFDIGNISVAADSIDLNKMRFDLKSVIMNQSNVQWVTEKSEKPDNDKISNIENQGSSIAWMVNVAGLRLVNDKFSMDDESSKPLPEALDYSHIHITNLNTIASALSISSEEYKGEIKLLSLSEKCGFDLKKLSGRLSYNDQQATLENLILETNHTRLNNQTTLTYASIASLSKKPGDMAGDLVFDHSYIGIKDLLLFVPALKPRFHNNENGQIKINGRFRGRMNNLTIPNLEIAGLQNTQLAFSGQIKGLPGGKNSIYDIQIKNLHTTKSDINIFLPENTIPKNIRIPESLSVNGRFDGTMEQFQTDISLSSSFGGAGIHGQLNIKAKQYDFKANLSEFDFGKLFYLDSLLGQVDLRATAKGEGFDFKTMYTAAHFQIPAVTVKGYHYKNLSMGLSMQNGLYEIHSVFDDQNMKGHLDAKGKWIARFPSLLLNLKMDTLNLQALHLVDSLSMSFNLHADLANTNPDTAEGKIYLTDLGLNYRAAHLSTDSIYLEAERKESIESIILRSEMADLNWTGRYKVAETYQALKQTINHYYSVPGFSEEKVSSQDWQMNLLFKPSPLVLAYKPTLNGSDSVQLSISLNSLKNDMHLSLLAPSIQFEDQFIHQLSVTADTKDSALNYVIGLGSANWAGLEMFRSRISGWLANNKFRNTLLLDDAKNRERYRVSTLFTGTPNRWKFSLLPDSLLLNYDVWHISDDNFIQYDSSGLFVNHFLLNHENQSLLINNTAASQQSPIEFSFNHFMIKSITSFAGKDSLLLDGEMNGHSELKDIFTHPSLTSNLTINNLAYASDTLGNLSVLVGNRQPNIFSTNISLEGKGNDFKVNGGYDSKEKSLDMDLNIGNLDLSVFKSLSAGQIKNIRGWLKGNLRATGSVDRPVLSGYLNFDSAYITPFLSGERLEVSTDSIRFDHEGIHLNHFTLLDSAGHRAVLDGHLYTNDYKHYRFDLAFNANNFILANTPIESNLGFYGKLNMDLAVLVKGDVSAPVVTGHLRVNKETDFTLILPNSDPEVVSRQSVVLFVDKDHPMDTTRMKTYLDSLNRNAGFSGISATVNIETDTSAKFTMIINERTGDALSVKGLASLSGKNNNGKLSLTGSYLLEDGAYNLSLKSLKRKFNLQKGSTITWTGDPTGATINLTATYICTTAPISLVGNQLSGLSQDELNKFNQRLPFKVNLKMLGQLVKPQITFSITLPSDLAGLWQDVESKLAEINSNESEVNKQVFALLLLNTFISENPFESTSGGNSTAGLLASQGVSSMLTTQLNELAGGIAKHVDLTMNVNSNQAINTSGQAINQTALQVGVSKNLFGDRVKVYAGSDFQLAGASQGPNASNIAGNVKIDYTLTPDGKYIIRVYSVNQYNTIVEGQVVQTGASFIITLDFDSFNELFQKNSTKEKRNTRQKEDPKKTNPSEQP